MVFYRKYRPQTISELDNEKLRETLYGIFAKTDFPHAFLFTGSKGLGKTSTARIIAKVVNCERKGEVEPCNVCETCVSITKGSNMDVLEIDGASNRGIDEIRDLREKVRLSPSSAKKKVYIIDEVHMLTTEAFNALLKTIEEPPGHVLFIFCTTEPQKIPATIISRCFHVSLALATEEELLRSFQRIVDGEKLQIDSDALKVIAQLANGGFRDGTKMLEEIALMTKDQSITKELVENLYKVSSIGYLVSGFLEAIQQKDARKGLELIAEGVKEGIDFQYFISQLLMELHSVLLHKMGIEEKDVRLKTYDLKMDEIQLLVALLTRAYQDMKYAVMPQLPLEMVIIGWASQEEKPRGANEIAVKKMPNVMKNIAYADKPTITSLLKKQHAIKVQNILNPQEVTVIVKSVSTMNQPSFPADGPDSQKTLLENLIYSVKTYNHSIAAVLRSCKIQQMNDASIIFETAYKFHKERLDDNKSKELLEKVVKEITGNSLSVNVVLKK